MTRDEAIQQACEIMALIMHSIGDYSEPSDGFCSKCPAATAEWNYQNSGKVFDYARKAILNQLSADGYKIASGFNDKTGKPYATLADREAALE
jgi:hypothetical protein